MFIIDSGTDCQVIKNYGTKTDRRWIRMRCHRCRKKFHWETLESGVMHIWCTCGFETWREE